MEDAACVVQLANKINEQSSTKVDLDEVNCVFLVHVLLSIVTVHIHGKYVIMLSSCIGNSDSTFCCLVFPLPLQQVHDVLLSGFLY